MQQQIYETIRRIEPRALSGEAVAAPAVSPELLPALRLAEQLSEFPVVGGNRFELLPVYDAAIDRIIADVDAAQRYVHMLFYIFENDDTGRQVAEALERARKRGVAVRVLMDAIGSRGGLKGLAPGSARGGRGSDCRDAAAPVGTERRALRPCATTARSSSSTARRVLRLAEHRERASPIAA